MRLIGLKDGQDYIGALRAYGYAISEDFAADKGKNFACPFFHFYGGLWLLADVDNKKKIIYNYSMHLKLKISCLRQQEGPYERKKISNYF